MRTTRCASGRDETPSRRRRATQPKVGELCVCLFVSFPRISVRFLCVQCISALCDVYVRLFCCLHCVCVLCVRAYHSPVYACVCLFPRVSGVSSFWRTVHVLRFVTCMCVLCVCVRIIRLCVHRLSG